MALVMFTFLKKIIKIAVFSIFSENWNSSLRPDKGEYYS